MRRGGGGETCNAGCQALEAKLSKYDSRTLGAWNPFGHLLLCTQWAQVGVRGRMGEWCESERLCCLLIQLHSGNDFNTFVRTKAT